MKKYILPLFVFAAVSITSCKDNTASESKQTTAESDVALPMPVVYKGTPAIGSNSNTVNVMNWNKWLSAGKLDSASSLLADSVTVRLSTGEVFNTSADSMMNIIKGYFGSMKTVNIQYVAVLPVDVKVSESTTDEWVFSWTDEEYTMADGSKEHNIIHEDYRMVNGKIREVNQYARRTEPAAPSGKTKK